MSADSNKLAVTLDTLRFPLHGARLIEASAGTGKTYTIAGLYLRLVLGHGCAETRHAHPLSVDQILVVTFTEAATAELRDRIRRRLHDARLAFARGASDDPLLRSLLAEFTDHNLAVSLLLSAERQMDEAAIFTIHGFCQRMLTQNAFESGSRFENEFVTDESRLKAQVVADYWRRQFYPLPISLASEVRRLWPAPSALLAEIAGYLSGPPVKLTTPLMEGDLAALQQAQIARICEIKQHWLVEREEIELAVTGSDLHKNSQNALLRRLPILDAWAQSETHDLHVPSELEEFTQSGLLAKSKKGNPPQLALFERIEAFLAEPVSLKTPLLVHAIHHCRHWLAKAKSTHHWLSFDDLLTQLSAALDNDEQGLLGERIRSLYPVAMIDEFQDTDPLQYSIFSRLYLDHPQCGLLMIGDPKQAIYAFRGADIFTYIKARNQVSAHYTLGTNWRSSAAMVAAVNQVFSSATHPFIYSDDIPFQPVAASPGADKRHWSLEGQVQPALTYWWPEDLDKPQSKTDYYAQMAEACAAQIQHILTASASGAATFHRGEAIEAGDLAVLVRTGNEARMVRDALSQQGIASVYLSNRDSVFASDVAQDIERLLLAVWQPEDERLLRAAVASNLFALTASELDALNNDENEWEQLIAEFRQYRRLWSERGVLPMLRAVLTQRHIAERWLAESEGERWLTDYLHISELLQQATREIDSDQGLLRFLTQAMADAAQGLGGSDEQIQRLESERRLVQIVTIHKSKGLEYPLVFLPFVMSYRESSEGKYYDTESATTWVDLTGNEDALAKADQERLAEDLRLLYVALTRAVYGCFIGIAPLRNGNSSQEPTSAHRSAMGFLLQDGQEGGIADLQQALLKQCENLPDVAQCPPPKRFEQAYQPPQLDERELTARELSQVIDRRWRVTSYSGLVMQSSHARHDPLQDIPLLEVGGFDLDSAQERDGAALESVERSIFNFPRGARPGTFLHSLFEEVDFQQSAHSEPNTKIILELMESEQIEAEWLPVLQHLVDTVLSTPLDGKALRLQQIMAAQRLTELEFLLPIEVLDAPTLNRITQRHDPLSAQAGDLGFHAVQGMLKGFIDLVFQYQGRYYVLDWKSNHLGDEPAAYHPQRLGSAMADHRYDLQYQIYALALHRFLRSRLAHYNYEQHFGGVFYLFLRGMDVRTDQGVFHTKPSLALLDELDGLIAGRELAQRASKAGQMELDL
ncbi:exodeoxyribonuclease V subunit beta [Vibrio cholerae]|uniref:RecBCD enzyme subunit RecB n=1 Tax=Vibrio cholerae TaxID=666 RepID=A0A395U5R4_VIBCL|nr:exodeoxyribonuclease V subunit beta [Vibrio cholerae]RGP91915.1 exodeoxyribonuclease V subunit beta [Vibrio cholerae]RGP92248.1 exodeoxyribonuclease V subunit beta [Vibrio cholerae]RGP92671.1 exodeoxyribonuclease V subunit beta [Vibrio cholerae]RGP96128.1 exodeoxyribonuclease V subunit beta [Vibrio cholerae]